MADITSFSLYNTKNIPADKIGFVYVNEIIYNSLTKTVSLKYSNDTIKDLGTVDPGTARKIINVTIDSSNHLIIEFDDATTIDAGQIMVEYEYSNSIPVGTGILSATEVAKFKPLVSGNSNVVITDTNGVTNVQTTLPAVDTSIGFAGALAYSNYAWFVEQWSSTAAIQGPLSVANTWQARILNTQRINNPGFVFNNTTGEVQLPVGTYYVTALGKSYRSSIVKLAIRDVTNDLTLLESITEVNFTAAASSQLTTNLRGYIKISAPVTIKLMQLSSVANSTATGGEANGSNATMGQTGTFAELSLWKIADTVLPDAMPTEIELDALILALQEQYYHSGNPQMTAALSTMGATLTGENKWRGSVVAPDGKIYCVPFDAADILIIDPVAGTATRSAMGATLTGTGKWIGGVLGPDGKIYCCPFDATDILIIDPVAGTATRSNMGATLTGTSKWIGGVLGPNGKIYGIPHDATDILIIDPVAGTATRSAMGATLTGATKWASGVLGPNGKIYGIPVNAIDILILDPVAGTATRSSMGVSITGSNKWAGGVLAPDGKIYCCPFDATDILIIDPANGTATRSALGATLTGATKWFGGVLGPDGKIYCIPHDAIDILILDPMTGTSVRSTMGLSLSSTAPKWVGGSLGLDGKIYGAPVDSDHVLIISNAYNVTMSNTLTLSPHLNKL